MQQEAGDQGSNCQRCNGRGFWMREWHEGILERMECRHGAPPQPPIARPVIPGRFQP